MTISLRGDADWGYGAIRSNRNKAQDSKPSGSARASRPSWRRLHERYRKAGEAMASLAAKVDAEADMDRLHAQREQLALAIAATRAASIEQAIVKADLMRDWIDEDGNETGLVLLRALLADLRGLA